MYQGLATVRVPVTFNTVRRALSVEWDEPAIVARPDSGVLACDACGNVADSIRDVPVSLDIRALMWQKHPNWTGSEWVGTFDTVGTLMNKEQRC